MVTTERHAVLPIPEGLISDELRERIALASRKELISPTYPYRTKLGREEYEAEKRLLQIELLQVQRWVADTKQRLLLIFEGRDAAGKGGTIKRFMEHLNPRGSRIVALSKPTKLERGQWFFQRYIERLPTRGEMVFFDRSWYNRAVVEPVMGFCTPEEHQIFLRQVPQLEAMLTESGITMFKFWFSVSREEQLRRFLSRSQDALKQWKLSPVDVESLGKWHEYTEVKQSMLLVTDTTVAPWTVVRSDDKKRARLATMKYVLSKLDYPERNLDVIGTPDPQIIGPKEHIYMGDDS
ncbi:MAG: polyphosphate kinase 2 [bacterium]|nr:polyphosphate kinase 2 [bacterium]MCP4963619.1 polyphosphate kinase 2 [bacterium]